MTGVAAQIFEEMHSEIISNGWLEQAIRLDNNDPASFKDRLRAILRELLASEKVEIGQTETDRPDYVSFIGWRGSIESRIERALAIAESHSELDNLFAYWLALRENVDRFESEN